MDQAEHSEFVLYNQTLANSVTKNNYSMKIISKVIHFNSNLSPYNHLL